jgi:UTP--glucose-1-phosphate uridylyltransferase
MQLEHAVITAAGQGQRGLPLQTLVDRDGVTRSALAIIAREILDAGIERIAVVVQPGDEQAYADAAGEVAESLAFIPQPNPRGYGHALHCARPFVGNGAFLHLVSDHLYLSHETRGCAKQLVDLARAEACAVSAVQATRETTLGLYGAIGGVKVPGRDRVYAVECVREKPTPTQAEQELVVPGMRAGHYLCYFGMHVLTPGVMDMLDGMLAAGAPDGKVQLSPALHELAGKEKYLAFEVNGARHNIGVKYGLFHAQLALALHGVDRDEVLTQMVGLLAAR